MPTRTLAPHFFSKSTPFIVTEALVLGLVHTLCASVLGLAANVSLPGVAILAVTPITLSALSGTSSSPLSQGVSSARPRKLFLRTASVLLLFAPALAFPGGASLLFALGAFLLWWLGTDGMRTALMPASPDESVSNRTELLLDLGLVPRPGVSTQGESHSSATRGPRNGTICACLALAFALLAHFYPPAANVALLCTFGACSLASWEQVFLALQSPRSPTP